MCRLFLGLPLDPVNACDGGRQQALRCAKLTVISLLLTPMVSSFASDGGTEQGSR